eukprot:TRINITY_DN17655_c0_g2_i1.p1 TRINITY_DN17655_c0_g2~~TRINITY_DN17655_c0_g2_i1.p1  ORF type:complete len:398 (+),score=89.73 TRINITY_DN17655_c0_g2_i1:2-1195(+)
MFIAVADVFFLCSSVAPAAPLDTPKAAAVEMLWGSLADDPESSATKRARAQTDKPVAALGAWENFLEARKRPRISEEEGSFGGQLATQTLDGPTWGCLPTFPGSSSSVSSRAWGDVDGCEEPAAGTSRRIPVDVHFGGSPVLSLEDGRCLKSVSPPLWGLVLAAKEAEAVSRGVDLAALCDGSSAAATPPVQAFAAAIRLTLASSGGKPGSEPMGHDSSSVAALWKSPSKPRALAQGCRDEAEAGAVEDALHAFDILRSASLLSLPRLLEAAESKLLAEGEAVASQRDPVYAGLGGKATSKPRGGDAVAMPLFALAFGTSHRRLSAACLQHVTRCGAELLEGRERQLGVLFATHPKAAVVLAGILRGDAVKKKCHVQDTGQAASPTAWDPVVADLIS